MASLPLQYTSNDFAAPAHVASEFVAEKVANLMEIAEALAFRLCPARGGVEDEEMRASSSAAASRHETALRVAHNLVAVRRSRERCFGEDMFSDPAWEVLIDLFIAQAEGKDVTIGDACIAAAVPLTSALRCCNMLQEREFVRREADARDKRRVLLRLTDASFARMIELLNSGAAA